MGIFCFLFLTIDPVLSLFLMCLLHITLRYGWNIAPCNVKIHFTHSLWGCGMAQWLARRTQQICQPWWLWFESQPDCLWVSLSVRRDRSPDTDVMLVRRSGWKICRKPCKTPKSLTHAFWNPCFHKWWKVKSIYHNLMYENCWVYRVCARVMTPCLHDVQLAGFNLWE